MNIIVLSSGCWIKNLTFCFVLFACWLFSLKIGNSWWPRISGFQLWSCPGYTEAGLGVAWNPVQQGRFYVRVKNLLQNSPTRKSMLWKFIPKKKNTSRASSFLLLPPTGLMTIAMCLVIMALLHLVLQRYVLTIWWERCVGEGGREKEYARA